MKKKKNCKKGYLFFIDRNFKDKMALASVCPNCALTYTQRKSGNKTPIRGFRTGFSKMIQILSKSLFSYLDNKKLIVFSDSREEAARTSNGIERSHYSELVRELIYSELSLIAKGKPALLSYLEGKDKDSNIRKKYEQRYPSDRGKIQGYIEHVNYCEKNSKKSLTSEIQEIYKIYKKKIDEIRQMETTRILPVKNFV